MMRNTLAPARILIVALAAAFLCGAQLAACEGEKPLVVCTTTVLASVVQDLAGDLVEVDVIASPAVCPAHYDIRPSDVEAFRRADLVLAHGFEPWIEELREASGSEAPIVRIGGPWNYPEALKELYRKVAEALSEHLGLDLSERLDRCLREIDEVSSRLEELAEREGFVGTPVVCMLWQEGFVKFLGFEIVAVYGPPERVSAKEYESVVENATAAGALLVIDNLQSGTELGGKIASEVGAVEVALSNFPGVAPELVNVTEVMEWNALKLADALREARVRGEVGKLREQISFWTAATIALSAVAAVEALAIAVLARKLKRG